MNSRSLLSGSALLVPLLLATQPADAQRVRADIRIGGGPISGHIRIGPDRYRDYRPRVIRVERLRWRDYARRPGWMRKWRHESRVVVVYRDRRDGFFYDRFRPGLHECQVYERDGRYYAWDDDRFYGRDDRYDRSDDRYDDRYRRDGRYDGRDDRYDDRYGDRDRRDDRDRRGGRDGRSW